ncbi:hypothetical protein CHGG_07944 [Chaetomium globosum CBS 148.51]|uniref:Life-span regulatory factor domain-containing protein n=1 Tax=Chaetomium globosum (strain ATCC 6205 / CBS 148.51 / DSM 1962 / NBRC 6347 / NRRL 1970) TaxID=306901 RepID=Q2GVR0_CHAGB|nr:uncharacterized protein CHGG_07944 [Chaetomium globosum CBS 148.51]EAQ86691.1 hypothetical protein CHGG_07944 [Chaetomium globosum CBS 148.51]
MASRCQTPPIRSQMTRVVPRQGHVMLTPCKKKFFLHTPRQGPLLLVSDKRGLAQIAAFGPLQDQPHHTSHPGPRFTRALNTTSSSDNVDTINHQPPTTVMSFDWEHQFCLGCDKQTDGATYCSESCRLADYEKTSPSTPSSAASSPALSGPPPDWTLSRPTTTSNTKFYLSPAYDFGLAQPSTRRGSTQTLSPSASHTSLCSMRSNSSAGLDAAQLSEKAARELRAYARSFESVRLQRRRSA